MKRTILIAVAAIAAMGCATKSPDMSKIAGLYYGQQRSAKLMEMKGVSEIHIKGSNMTFAISSQLAPLNILPRDADALQMGLAVLKDVALGGLGIYTAGQVMTTLADKPQVVSQQVVEPTIVQPQVITAK